MLIGKKEYTPYYNNRKIWELEDAFDGMPIETLLNKASNMELNTKQVGLIIWHGIKDEITLDEFIDSIELGQYQEAGKECGEMIVKAFQTGIKKK